MCLESVAWVKRAPRIPALLMIYILIMDLRIFKHVLHQHSQDPGHWARRLREDGHHQLPLREVQRAGGALQADGGGQGGRDGEGTQE